MGNQMSSANAVGPKCTHSPLSATRRASLPDTNAGTFREDKQKGAQQSTSAMREEGVHSQETPLAQLLSSGNNAETSRKASISSLDTGVCCKPHPNKISTGGEDAFIVRECNGIWLTGVLDGVGSWKSTGVDPAIYSRTFAQRVTDHFVARYKWKHHTVRDKKNVKPLLKILEKAFADMQRSGIKGSCTVCLAMLFPSGKLHVLNLGDSGVRVVRNGQVVFASKAQQIFFNTPRQLGDRSKDVPSKGDYSTMDVRPGDLYLIASDGAWDNLWEQDWLKMVHGLNGVGGLNQLASRLCEVAQQHGADKSYISPFAAQAKKIVAELSSKENLDQFSGGKLDDTTVVIGQVIQSVV